MRTHCSLPLFLAAACLLLAAGCPKDDEDRVHLVSSRSYKGHESDVDSNNFVRTYPYTVGTRLDDCQTCHCAGEATHSYKGTMTFNPCSWCHLKVYPDSDLTGAPTTYYETLNDYGKAYMNAGRSEAALRSIAGQDSDADGYTNNEEVMDFRYPGDDTSFPGQPFAPLYTFTETALKALTGTHEQFLLMNSHKQRYDNYAFYRGLKVVDILAAAGVNMTGVTGVTILAPDGYAKDFTLSEMQNAYPDGEYWGNLDEAGFGDPDQAFVEYPPSTYIPTGISSTGGLIPDEMWLMIAYWRDGTDMDAAYLDPTSGKLEGEGPYRIIVPQTTPGSPDRGSSYSPTTFGDGWDYDDDKDHNAGLCVRGVVAIRVNPMPAGYEEFDWKNGGFSYLEEGKLFLYGQGVSAN